MNHIRHLGYLGLLSVTLAACGAPGSHRISAADLDDIKAADQNYATAWLKNDSDQVMETLIPEATIVPSGMAAIKGARDIRAFWWPEDSPPTLVTRFTLVQSDVSGDGDTGYVRGSFVLEFEYDGDSYSGSGEYLSLLRRENTMWRISHRMWSDRPRHQDN